MRVVADAGLADLACRLRERRLYKMLDLSTFGYDEGVQRGKARQISGKFKDQIDSKQVIKDEDAIIRIYTQIGGDDDRAHKKLHILDPHDELVEITRVSKLIELLVHAPPIFTRYYFENEADRDAAKKLGNRGTSDGT